LKSAGGFGDLGSRRRSQQLFVQVLLVLRVLALLHLLLRETGCLIAWK
jgi:hypothetical protein